MAILSTLLAASPPTGVWETIIRAFESFAGSYILAIILLTVVIRIVWSPIDTLNKRMTQKMTANQAKMQPELEKLKAKYANNPQLLKQKENELYKKYNTNSIGSCVFMLVFFGLNLAIFLTLWTGLNSMSAYKINESYENLKYDYANCLNWTNDYLQGNENNASVFEDIENLSFEIYDDDGEKYIVLMNDGQNVAAPIKYETSFADGEGDDAVTTNKYINDLIVKYVYIPEKGEETDADSGENENKLVVSPEVAANIQTLAMKVVVNEYDSIHKQDQFLWIQNIWVADSPLQNSIFDYSTFEAKVGKKNIEEGEKNIYNAFMKPLKDEYNRGKVNGYFLLPVLCVLATFLTMWLTTRKQKKAVGAQPGGKATKIIMPMIFGIFALFYSAVFAIYMFASQLISAALIPLQNLILKKWDEHSENKKKSKVEVVDYSRKF